MALELNLVQKYNDETQEDVRKAEKNDKRNTEVEDTRHFATDRRFFTPSVIIFYLAARAPPMYK